MTFWLDFSATKTPILISVVSLGCFAASCSTDSGGNLDEEGDISIGEGDMDLNSGLEGGESSRELDGSGEQTLELDASLDLQFVLY